MFLFPILRLPRLRVESTAVTKLINMSCGSDATLQYQRIEMWYVICQYKITPNFTDSFFRKSFYLFIELLKKNSQEIKSNRIKQIQINF